MNAHEEQENVKMADSNIMFDATVTTCTEYSCARYSC